MSMCHFFVMQCRTITKGVSVSTLYLPQVEESLAIYARVRRVAYVRSLRESELINKRRHLLVMCGDISIRSSLLRTVHRTAQFNCNLIQCNLSFYNKTRKSAVAEKPRDALYY